MDFILEELLVSIAQELADCNSELEQKKVELQTIKKMDIAKMMKF